MPTTARTRQAVGTCKHWLRRGLTVLAMTIALAGCHGHEAPPVVTSTQPLAIDTPPPAYPAELACEDIGGQVVLLLTIGIDGRPSAARMTQSSRVAELDKAAHEAVRSWRFEPATRNGQPVPIKINVPVTFTPPKVRPETCFVLDEQRKSAN